MVISKVATNVVVLPLVVAARFAEVAVTSAGVGADHVEKAITEHRMVIEILIGFLITFQGRFPERSGYGDQGKRDFNRGSYRGGGARGSRGGFRGRSEPPRGGGGGANNRYQKPRHHGQVPVHHAGSDSGSDWGDNKNNEPGEWGKTEKWERKKEPRRNRVDSSGWDEPESLNAQNWNETKQQPPQQNRKYFIVSIVLVYR